MVTVKPCKNTRYFGFSCSYLKNEFGAHFLNRRRRRRRRHAENRKNMN